MLAIISSKRHQELLEREQRLLALEAVPRYERNVADFAKAFATAPDLNLVGELVSAVAAVNRAYAMCERPSPAWCELYAATRSLAVIAKAVA